ncbi:hypothetical protein SLA2020_428290 [Shorea laevis]
MPSFGFLNAKEKWPFSSSVASGAICNLDHLLSQNNPRQKHTDDYTVLESHLQVHEFNIVTLVLVPCITIHLNEKLDQ